jgi:hypothetical protein
LLEGFFGKTYLMKDWLKDYCQMLLGEIIVCNIISSFMIAKKSQELIKSIPCQPCCQSLVFVRNCSMFHNAFVYETHSSNIHVSLRCMFFAMWKNANQWHMV